MRNDPLNITNLISWLETKPATDLYDFFDSEGCLMAQWFKSCGAKDVVCGGCSISYDDKYTPIPANLDRISIEKPWTYGAALERAKGLA